MNDPIFHRPGARRPGWLLLLLLPILPVGLGPPAPAAADETPSSAEEEERLEDIERHTERGWKAWHSGNHEEVLARMERLARLDPANTLPPYLTARSWLRTGRYGEAEALLATARAAHPADRRLRLAAWRLLRALARHDEARSAAEAWLAEHPADLPARVLLGWAAEARGQRAAAYAAYEAVVKAYQPRTTDPEDVPWVAEAALGATRASTSQGVDLKQDVLDLLGRYAADHPDDLDARFALAEVWREDRGPRGQSRARKELRALLEDNSEYADARVAIARTDLVFWQQNAALKQLDRALATNPRHVEALALRAAIRVGNGDYDQARADLAAAAEVAPRDKEVRAVRAALAAVVGDEAAYEREVAEVLAYDPTFGTVHVRAAELLGERRRRYDLAADEARKALAVDPHDPAAYVVLGEALMNLGETAAAREAFGKGITASKRHEDVHRDNWIMVLDDVLPLLKGVESEHFAIRMPAREANVLKHYLPDLLEDAHRVLGAKYGFEVTTPIHVDAFDRPDDFSVRSIGTPGLPALGVCFGRVITLLGPTAQPLGQFSWSRTAWHEYAHVVTLQQSQGQVPRWLTEGLSVFEESQRKALWARDMERQLHDRYHNDRLLRMGEINSAFQGPDILFAYYQGGLIAEHLMKDRGFDVIPAMLRAFGEDRTTAEVFQQVLGLELATYDASFRTYVQGLVKDYRLVPTWDEKSLEAFAERTRRNADDAEAWVRLAWAHFQRRREVDAGAALAKARALAPEHPEVRLLLGTLAAVNKRHDLAREHLEAFLASGSDDLQARLYLADRALRGEGGAPRAIEHLEAAKRCFPPYAGEDTPYLQLAKLYRGAGEVDKAIAELTAYALVQPNDYPVRKQLMAWARERSQWDVVARLGAEMVDISPFGAGAELRSGKATPDMDLHRHYAEALTHLERPLEALRERRVQVELGYLLPEATRIEAGCLDDQLALGEALLAQGLADEALEAALGALRLSPASLPASMLKQRAIEAGGGR